MRVRVFWEVEAPVFVGVPSEEMLSQTTVAVAGDAELHIALRSRGVGDD
jgi:hypothetical protein